MMYFCEKLMCEEEDELTQQLDEDALVTAIQSMYYTDYFAGSVLQKAGARSS